MVSNSLVFVYEYEQLTFTKATMIEVHAHNEIQTDKALKLRQSLLTTMPMKQSVRKRRNHIFMKM